MRKIQRIVTADEIDMGGVPILQSLPNRGLQHVDPFLLIHHWKQEYPGGEHPSDLGVPPHPHKGFSPVTFIYKGALRHLDSRGNDSIVRAGGTQWMFSDGGIVHSERPDMSLAKDGGDLELIQFWINSPAKNKEDEPQYIPLSGEETPEVASEDGLVHVGVVAGKLKGVKGPIEPHSPMTLLRMTGKDSGTITIDIPSEYNALFYVLDGSVSVDDKVVDAQQLAVFEHEGSEKITMQWEKAGRVLFLSGAPIDESLATYGPFVMNDQRGIMNALQEAQSGAWGELEEQWSE